MVLNICYFFIDSFVNFYYPISGKDSINDYYSKLKFADFDLLEYKN